MKKKGQQTKSRKLLQQIQLLEEEQSSQTRTINYLNRKVGRYQELTAFAEVFDKAISDQANTSEDVWWKGMSKLSELLCCKWVRVYLYEVGAEPSKSKLIYRPQGRYRKLSPSTFKLDQSSYVGASALENKIYNLGNLDSGDPAKKKRYEELIEETAIHSLLVAPALFKGKLRAVVEAINSDQRQFNGEDVAFMRSVAHQVGLFVAHMELVDRVRKMMYQVCLSFAESIGHKDRYTGGHTKRVGMFAEMIAKELGLNGQELSDLRLAGVLHDIGKIGIEDKILKKRAPLTEEEFEVMKGHPRIGHEILGHIQGLETVVDAIRYHHERPDGKGYPYGLAGSEIPLLAHIISVADTFDAMISTRPYRKGLPPMVAYKEILKYRGTQFDPVVVDAFARSFRKTHMYRPDRKSKVG